MILKRSQKLKLPVKIGQVKNDMIGWNSVVKKIELSKISHNDSIGDDVSEKSVNCLEATMN